MFRTLAMLAVILMISPAAQAIEFGKVDVTFHVQYDGTSTMFIESKSVLLREAAETEDRLRVLIDNICGMMVVIMDGTRHVASGANLCGEKTLDAFDKVPSNFVRHYMAETAPESVKKRYPNLYTMLEENGSYMIWDDGKIVGFCNEGKKCNAGNFIAGYMNTHED